MILFTIDDSGKQYRICAELGEITIGAFVKVSQLNSKPPRALLELTELVGQLDKLGEGEERENLTSQIAEREAAIWANVECFKFFASIIAALSDVPADKLQQLEVADFQQLWFLCAELIRQANEYKPTAPDKIDYKGETWYLVSGNFNNQTIAAHIQAQHYIENAKNLQGGNFEAIHNLIPLLVRKDPTEMLTIEKANERAGYFADLPLPSALDIGFFLQRLLGIWKQRTAIYSTVELLGRVRKPRR